MSISSALANIATKMVGFGINLTKSLFGQDTSSYVPPGRPPKLKKESEIDQKSPTQMLGGIFELMQKKEQENKKEKAEQESLDKRKYQREIERTDALIKALSVKRKTVKKQVKEKKVSKEEKPAPTEPTPTPSAPTKPTPTPTPTAPSAPPTPPAKAPTTTPVKPTTPAPSATKIPSPTAITGVIAAGGLAALSSSVIAKEEGLPKGGKAYWDPPGQSNLVSIGYGHQIRADEYKQGFIQAGDEQVPIKGEKGIDTVMTPSQAKKLLQIDVPKYEQRAKKPLGDSWNKLNDNQKAALTSYAYNTGSTESLVKAGLKEAIDSDNMKEAARIIREKGIKTAQGKYLKALDTRRQKEAALFESVTTEKTPTPIGVPNIQTGAVIDNSSKENKQLKDTLKEKQTPIVTNTSLITPEESEEQETIPDKVVDDRNIYLKKSKR